MNVQTPPGIRIEPGTSIALGAALVLLGVACVVFPFIASIAVQAMVAATLIAGGLAQVLMGFRASSHGWITAVAGALSAAAGFVMLFFPLPSMFALTLFLVAALVVAGVARIVHGVRCRGRKGWGWLTLGGAMSLVLAAIVLAELPVSAFWILGVVLAADLIATGSGLLVLGAAAMKGDRDAEETRADRSQPEKPSVREASDEDRLEAALQGTFPASDAPSLGR